ncbi:MAG TPA: hypothetical protein VGD21_03495 [Lysobacter sp.]
MHTRTESSPQEVKPRRGNGVERIPADHARPIKNASTAGKAEDMVALLADRMRHGEARR